MLGVRRGASEDEIKRAYRKLAMRHHPDVNKGDSRSEDRFKAINEAYDVLGDPGRRRDYDEFGSNWRHAEQLRSGAGGIFGGAGGSSSGFGNFGDFNGGDGGFSFARLFGFGESSRERAHELTTEISLEQAYSGTECTVHVPAHSGKSRPIVVKIPAGITDGGKIRIRPSGMAPVDVQVRITKHRLFERTGDDLRAEFSVPFHVPVLGGTASIPTMDGTAELTVPEGTQNGRVFRLAGKGMPQMRGAGRGDLLAKLKVTLPTLLSPEERDLFRQIRELGNHDQEK